MRYLIQFILGIKSDRLNTDKTIHVRFLYVLLLSAIITGCGGFQAGKFLETSSKKFHDVFLDEPEVKDLEEKEKAEVKQEEIIPYEEPPAVEKTPSIEDVEPTKAVQDEPALQETKPQEEKEVVVDEVLESPVEKPDEPDSSELSATKTVLVKHNTLKFIPKKIIIKVGETVTWINEDKKKHNFISVQDGSTDELEIFHLAPPGDVWEHTFYEPGSYPYYCFIHSRMRGEIVVLPE